MSVQLNMRKIDIGKQNVFQKHRLKIKDEIWRWSWYPPCCESPKQCLKNVCYCECKVLPMIMNLIVILKVVNVLLWTSWKSLLWKNHQSSVSVPARVRTLSWCSVPSETFGHSDKSHFIIFPFTVDSGGMVGGLGTLGEGIGTVATM